MMTNSENNLILKTTNLTVGYTIGKKKKAILEKINIDLVKGRLNCLLGENGVGKSTLLKTIAGVIPPLSGEINIEGKNLSSFSGKEFAKKVSVVFTGTQRPGMLNAKEIIANGRYPYTSWSGGLKKEDEDAIDNAMEITHTKHLADENVAELSDGQMQKVMIARALAQDSDIILLDEPTAFLDINNRLEIMQLLKKMSWETGKAILVSTHDLETAFHTADLLWLATCCAPIVIGAPEDLILDGQIGELFDSKSYAFDPMSGMFKSSLNPVGEIQLKGDGLFFQWTKSALERIGYAVNEKEMGTKKIEIMGENKKEWIMVTEQGEQHRFSTINALTLYLRQQINSR